MVIEINKDIERYKESVVMGLTAKQLLFSALSIAVGGGIVLLLYRHIGLTPSVYVAIPAVVPIAMQGFYSFNGMSFCEVMRKKFHMIFANRSLSYESTEGEAVLKELLAEDAAKEQVRIKKQKRKQYLKFKEIRGAKGKKTKKRRKQEEDSI